MQDENNPAGSLGDSSGRAASKPAAIARRYTVNVFSSTSAKTPHKSRTVTAEVLAAAIHNVRPVPRKVDAPLVTLVTYRDGATSRAIADIEAAHAVYGDIDGGFSSEVFEAGMAELARMGAQVVAHQTYSHTPDAPRWRVIVLLDEPALPSEYRACWEGLNAVFGGTLDGNAKDCSRLNYWPSCPPGETREVRTLNIGAMQ